MTNYRVVEEIARGGMGVVLLGARQDEDGSFTPVAIKRMHSHLVDHPEVVNSFVDEARIASRLAHPNVVNVHAVEMLEDQLVIIMDYVEGVALRELIRGSKGLPIGIVRRILIDFLNGLQVAHDLTDDNGQPLGVVHRDISPHNLLVGTDGVTKVADFGIAFAKGRLATTKTDGAVKGKLQYLSPEQVMRQPIDRRTDVFAAGLVAWEALVGRKCFDAETEGEAIAMVLREPIVPPSNLRLDVPLDLDETVLRALERDVGRRFKSAAEFARAIEEGGPVASAEEVGELVLNHSGESLLARRSRLTSFADAPPAIIEELIDYDGPTQFVLPSTMSSGGTMMEYAHPIEPQAPLQNRRAISPPMLVLGASVLILGALLVGFIVKAQEKPPTLTFEDPPAFPPPPALPTQTQGTVIGASPDQPPAPQPTQVAPPPPPNPSPRPQPAPTHKPAPAPAPGPQAKRDAGKHPFMPDDL